MTDPIRWTVQDRYGNSVYLTQERWEHIIESINHPEMADYEEELQETVRTGTRKQDTLNPKNIVTRKILTTCQRTTHTLSQSFYSVYVKAKSAKSCQTILLSLLTRKK